MEIRPATRADVGALLDLVQSCINGMRAQGIEQWDEVYPDAATIEGDVNGGTAFVATVDRIVVGMAVLNEHQDPEYSEVSWRYSGRVAVVHRLMVVPLAEGKGVARALMTFLEALAASRGYDCIRLDAFQQNGRAVQFYERSEYRRAGQVRFRKGDFDCFEKHLGRAG
jgi:GNAT superfamily N-acetyltransferase